MVQGCYIHTYAICVMPLKGFEQFLIVHPYAYSGTFVEVVAMTVHFLWSYLFHVLCGYFLLHSKEE